MTHSYVRHDSFVRVTRLPNTCTLSVRKCTSLILSFVAGLSVPLYLSTSLLHCNSASLFLCLFASMPHCLCTFLSLCFFASLPLYLSAYLPICFYAFRASMPRSLYCAVAIFRSFCLKQLFQQVRGGGRDAKKKDFCTTVTKGQYQKIL